MLIQIAVRLLMTSLEYVVIGGRTPDKAGRSRLIEWTMIAAFLSVFCAHSAFAQPAPQDPLPSLHGTGFITLPDTRTHRSGHVTFGIGIDNRDRDPLGMDLLDGCVIWSLGLSQSVEAYGQHVFTRVVSLPELPALPPPPLDLIVPSGAPIPARPYYALNPEVPYLNKRGSARFDSFVPGDELIGLKKRLLEPVGWRPGVAIAGEIKIPLSKESDDLQSGSGTGGIDLAARMAAEWRAGAWDVLVGVGFTRVGQPPRSDRMLMIANDSDIHVDDLPLRLPHRLDLGIGARWRLSRKVTAVTEVTTTSLVGSRTPTLDPARPVDLLLGAQLRFGHARATVAWRYHGNALPSGEVRMAPLAGGVDLSDVAADARLEYLRALGLEQAEPYLRSESQKLVAPPVPNAALPAGARVVPGEYRIRSEHQMGFIMLLGWTL
jgi:hypothetical protein